MKQLQVLERPTQESKEIGKFDVEKIQTLKSLLTEEQIVGIDSGSIIAICQGQKMGLNDMVHGTVFLLSPLVGG